MVDDLDDGGIDETEKEKIAEEENLDEHEDDDDSDDADIQE